MAFARRTEAVTKTHVNLVARIVAGAIPGGDPDHHSVAYGSLKKPVIADGGRQSAFIYVLKDDINVSSTISLESMTLPSGITIQHAQKARNALEIIFTPGITKLTEQLQALLNKHTIPVVEAHTRSHSAPRERHPAGGAHLRLPLRRRLLLDVLAAAV